jgi:hypothetical protein
LLIRNNLPDKYRGFITEAMGASSLGGSNRAAEDADFTFYQNHHEGVFLTSAVLTFVLLRAHHVTSGGGREGFGGGDGADAYAPAGEASAFRTGGGPVPPAGGGRRCSCGAGRRRRTDGRTRRRGRASSLK